MKNKKVAVITGASSGIGKAIAIALAKQQYLVVNADVNPSGTPNVDHHACDITSAKDIHELWVYVRHKYGVPDVLISNAGQGIHEKLAEGDPEKWKRVMDINVVGALRFVRAFLPEMIGNKTGDIVFVSSIAAEQPYEYGGVYSASKAALNMIADTLRLEARELRVSVLSPGVVDTAFFEHMISSNHNVDDIGLGCVSADKVAETVCNILSLSPEVSISKLVITPKDQRV
ncbi:3-oxoacyl-[acyl-carrier protein] reductase [Fulvivirga imtechensis AK7]|uniref:3-oxoacyl-[acyl-carrier protein] reductase n=1 Tax=Fulvivirga imtechensis AK7 TaxID=1237149 RepID=L8JP25_9BACT|nr:SDR family NAD(P)-dependent oxidoreductase [Fulvivirga imtechensis]ELR69137.1 3-oxoacyl-[acyl-carrier protein] reductase [Fulvivirga imtechensis AK7]